MQSDKEIEVAKEDVSSEVEKSLVFVLPDEHTADMNRWKAKHRVVKYLDVDGYLSVDSKKNPVEYVQGKPVFFRQPTRMEMSAAEALAVNEDGQVDSYKKAEKLLVDCYLGGAYSLEELLDDIEIFMSVAEFCLYELVKRKNVNWGSC